MAIEFKTPLEAWEYHYWYYRLPEDIKYLAWLNGMGDGK